MNWIKTSDKLPDRVEGKSYSQVPCLVSKRYEFTRDGKKRHYFQVQILVFNHEHECWDQEDGDDHDCPIDQVEYWMLLPQPPTT